MNKETKMREKRKANIPQVHRYNRVSVNIEILPRQWIHTHSRDCDFLLYK